jgi:indolepyruvate ferredoxin oxidoreductase alpha subunit
MVRAMQPPLRLFDVKYSMGAGLGLGMGLALRDPEHHVVALLGDSSFLHSGLNALPQAVQLNPRLLVIILDNETTGLTGGQPHSGSPTDERGQPRPAADLARVVAGLGIEPAVCDARNVALLSRLYDEGLASDGLRVIIARAPCPLYVDPGTAK